MSPHSLWIVVLAIAILIVAVSGFVEWRIRSNGSQDEPQYERLVRQRRVLRLTLFAWVGLGFVVQFWQTYDGSGHSSPWPGFGPDSRPGEPYLVGVFLFTFLAMAAWVACGQWMSAIVAKRYPGAPVLDSEKIWNVREKYRQSREFDRWIDDEGSRRDPLLGKLHRADRILLKVLYVGSAIFAMTASVVFWPF